VATKIFTKANRWTTWVAGVRKGICPHCFKPAIIEVEINDDGTGIEGQSEALKQAVMEWGVDWGPDD